MSSDKFTDKFYKTCFIILIILALGLVYAGTLFDVVSYVKRFSGDNTLAGSTIQKIISLKKGFLISGIILAGLILIIRAKRQITEEFLLRKKSTIQGLILLLAIIIIFFIAMEVYLRITLRNETSLYGFGPGSINFNKNYVGLNNEGMRDNEYSLNKQNNTIRIVITGDSFTFGSGIKNVTNVFVEVLEKKLNERNDGKKYEVINFGVPGLDFTKQLGIIKNQAMKYDPDIVMYATNINDIDVDKADMPTRSKGYKILAIPGVGFWLRNSLYSYYFIESRINRLLENVGLRENVEEYLIRAKASGEFDEYNSKIIKEMIDYPRQRGKKVAVIIFPLIHDFSNYSLMPLYDSIIEENKKNGVEPIGILEAWKNKEPEELVVNKYDSHPNELGHELAAEKIYQEMIKQELV